MTFITLAAMFVLSVYKSVQRNRENVLANDQLIGFLISFLISGSCLTMLLFMNKYIVFRIKVQSDSEQKTCLKLRVIEKSVACTLIFIFLCLGVFVVDVKSRNLLFKVGLGINFLTISWLMFETMIQFNFLINQLSKVRDTLLASEKKKRLKKLLRSIQALIIINCCLVLVVLLTILSRLELFIWMFHVYLFAIYCTNVGMNLLYRRVDWLNKSGKTSKSPGVATSFKALQCEQEVII